MRRYFMVNGPLGGNMGTPPVEPQPPQVSFTTTAESRGGFNNFLKSIPQTTNMTPIPPLGSAPTAPMSNPMGNIDIFNQPPSMGMGMMGMNQPQMQQPMQPPMQQPMMGGLMSKPIQNFFDGGGVDDSDFGGFSDYGSVDATSDDGFSEDNDVSDYSTDDSGVYTGGDDSNQDIALPTPRPEILKEAVGRSENQVFGDTEGDALGFFNKSGGLTDAGQKEYDNAIMANLDVLQDERPTNTGIQLANVFDDQSILGDSTKNVNPADIVQASFKPGSLNPTFSNNVLDGLDLSASLGQNRNRNVEPEAFDMFGNPMSTLTNQPGVSISNRAMQQMVDNDLADRAFSKGNFSMIGPADPDMDALERSIANTQRANEIQNQLANVNDQTLADRLQNQRGLDRNISTTPDTALETMIDRRDIFQPDNIGTGQQRVDTSLENMAGRRDILPDQVYDFNTDVMDRNPVDTSLEIINPSASFLRSEADRKNATLDRDANVRDMDDIDIATAGRASDFPTLSTSTVPEDFEENVGRPFDAKRMEDIERLYGEDVSQTKAGRGSDPTFFEGKGFTGTAGGILDAIERKTRENMANEIALGRPMGLGETLFGYNAPDLRTQTMEDYMSNTQKNVLNEAGDSETVSRRLPDNQLIRNDSGRVIGIRDASGRLVSGMDPNAPMDTGNDNNENPLILRPIAKAPEEEKEEEKLPNVIGGGETPAPVSSGSVVVDSPFTSNVGNFIPSSFNTGELNKLIEALTGVPAPRNAIGRPVPMQDGGVAGYAEGGRVMQALDNLLATG